MRWLFFFFILVGCTERIERPGAEITFAGDRLFYRGRSFTGVVTERFPQAETIRESHYRDGVKEGLEEERLFSGSWVARRYYEAGKKVGVHEGRFADGRRRFRYEYKADLLNGESWEWYASGALSLYARFVDGTLLGKKMWRESGQIYMNYVFTKNKAYGTPGTSLCYQLRDGVPDTGREFRAH